MNILTLRSVCRAAVTLLVVGMLGACAAPPAPDEINDPFETVNRGVHNFNKGLDRAVLRGASKAYVTVVPDPIVQGISNATANLEQPSRILNGVLQGRVENALHNSMRFFVNSTIGLAGFLDPATEMGLEERDTDFGETLYVWGVGEGAYVSVPFLGPHTTRHIVGRAVDVVTDPIGEIISVTRPLQVRATLWATDQLKDRQEFATLVDNTLYNSTDSYATTRILYLQNRRFRLGQNDGPDYFDPYDDPTGAGLDDFGSAPGDDLYFDPYEDPYAQ